MQQIYKTLLACFMHFFGLVSFAQSFHYDPLNRLTQIAYPDGTVITYQYDKLGNRTGQTVVAGQECTAPTLMLTGSDFSGVYRSQGQLTAVNADVKVADFVSDTGILLEANFTVELGCDFDAYILPCVPGFTGGHQEKEKKQ